MGLYKQYIHPKYQWGIWELSESLEELKALLPDEGEKCAEELDTFKSEFRKKEWLAVRVLLYRMLGEFKHIHYHSNGKPYFADNKLHISISHTKGYVAVIISATNEVGIDIEKSGERIHKIAHKFVRDDEHLPQEPELRTNALLLIWSAKEVIFKCMNEKEVDFREHMHIDLNELDGTWVIGSETRTPLQRKYLIYYMLHPDFVMTWTIC